MQGLFDRLFARYGSSVLLGTETVNAFFFSVNSRSWQNMERVCGPLGEIPRGQYICVLPYTTAPVAGDILTVGQKSYEIRRAEEMRVKEDVVYHWCLCVGKGGDDTW